MKPSEVTIGLEACFDPSWPAGLTYVRNVVKTLASLPVEERPYLRLLPLDLRSLDMVKRLPATYDRVEVAAPKLNGPPGKAILVSRRLSRKFLQPRVGRPLHRAFRSLDVTFPGWGRAIPGVPQINWIPDLQHVHLPRFFYPDEIRKREEQFARIAATPTTVILSSRAALDDFTRTYPHHKASPEVWAFCSDLDVRDGSGSDPRAIFGLPPRYIYLPNQMWAHKDHLTTFEALVRLRREGVRPFVVCTGLLEDRRDPDHVRRVQTFLDDNHLRDQVRLLGMVDRGHQIQILRHAAFVLQPSRFEGWSTVVEDTKAVGRPLVVSRIPVHLEQAADAAFFHVGDSGSLASVLRELWTADVPPGPDVDAEQEAAERTAEQRRLSALRFLEIVQRTLEPDPPQTPR